MHAPVKGRPSALLLLFAAVALGAPPLLAAPPDLKVTSRLPAEPTGTMHFADSVTLRIGKAKALVLKGDGVPIPGPWFRMAPSRFLLLGWSSTGAGMQTVHALSLAVKRGAVALVSELTLTTDRSSSGILVRDEAGGPPRLGIPEPPSGFLHDPDGWALSANPSEFETLDLDGLLGLTFEAGETRKGDALYPPPLEKDRFPERVAWVSIAPSGSFVLPPRASTPESLLRRLYAAHRPWSGYDVRYDGGELAVTTLARFLEAPLLDGLRRDEECRQQTDGVGRFDFDPFLDAQDYDGLGVSGFRAACVTAGADATCAVSFRLFPDEPASEKRLTFRLAESAGGWRIRDVDWGREETLAGILSRPCE